MLLCGRLFAQFEDPFTATAELSQDSGVPVLVVTLTVPDGHYLYEEQLSVEVVGDAVIGLKSGSESKQKYDAFQEKTVGIYQHDVRFSYGVTFGASRLLTVTVSYQGCDDKTCYFPQSKKFSLLPGKSVILDDGVDQDASGRPAWADLADQYEVKARTSGYVAPEKFLAFLRDEEAAGSKPARGMILTLLGILLGGLLLNLTPCVLPMIPINLAIIGAGAAAQSKGRGFALGAAYGAGMAIVYGGLGLIVILTSAQFGALNASPWFNLAITVLFLLMSMAMFGVINVDLSKFQHGGPNQRKGSFWAAAVIGGVAALLAGACVAPVLLSVLVLARNLYSGGNNAGLLLPFLLGVGMALPWPLAGAGMGVLPKPGKWMEYVKYGFGVLILGMALYYGHLTYQLLSYNEKSSDFGELLQQSDESGKPILIDFWAHWCKNCMKMEKTTFVDEAVVGELENFSILRYDATDSMASSVKEVMDYYEVVGLPVYLVLERKDE